MDQFYIEIDTDINKIYKYERLINYDSLYKYHTSDNKQQEQPIIEQNKVLGSKKYNSQINLDSQSTLDKVKCCLGL